MRSGFRYGSRLLLALLLPVAMTGCGGGYQVYDPSYRDYHRWNDHEAAYYQRWEGETHRNHSEFRQRPVAEQNEYWSWRHSH